MSRFEEELLDFTDWLVNCGGKGGTKGPCPKTKKGVKKSPAKKKVPKYAALKELLGE